MLQLIVIIVLVGVGLYLINQYIPMAPPIKTILNVVVILVLIIWIISAFGILDRPVPRMK